MSDIENRAFWEAVAADGPVPYDELTERVAEVLEEHPEWARLSDADTTVLYSGRIGPDGAGSTTLVAQDLAERGQGTIGIIDNTPAGRALGEMTASLSDATIETKFAGIIDFSDAPMTSAEWAAAARGPDGPARAEAWAFSGELYDTFKPSSQAFASQLSGNVITVTPDADIGRDFRTQEVPNLVERIESGHVTHVNGVPAEEITARLDGLTGETRLDAAFEMFNESFADNIRAQGLDVHIREDVIDGRTVEQHRLDVDQDRLPDIGAGSETRITDPDLTDFRSVGLSDTRTAPEPDRGVGTPEPDSPRAPDTPEDGPRVRDMSTPRYSIDDLHEGSRPGTESLDSINQRILNANEAENLRGFAATPDGSTSFLLDSTDNRIYTVTDGQVSHVANFNDSRSAGHAFGGLMREAANSYPDTFHGLPDVHNSLGALGNHIDDLGRPAWRRALGSFGDETADLVGKGSKILGPLGVAAAGAEVYGLEMKLQDYVEFGLVPEDAMLAYRGILTAHTAQATVDPSLLGGELVVQEAHDQWAEAYGIPDDVKEALEPGSLLEDAADAAAWLEAQARAAGMAVRDYAVDRFNNPEKIADDLEAIRDGVIDGLEDLRDGAGELLDDAGDYIDSRYNDPSLLLDDAQEGLNNIRDSWNSYWGVDDPSALEEGLSGDESAGVNVPVENVIARMNADYVPVQETIEAQADSATLDFDTARVGKMLSQSGTFELYPTLQRAGVESVTVPPHDVTEPIERMDAAFQAGAREMETRELTPPESDYMPEHDRTGISNETFSEAATQAGLDASQAIQRQLQQQQMEFQTQRAELDAQQDAAADML